MGILVFFPMEPSQLMFLIVRVDYFTKWIEYEAIFKITNERVRHFYWKRLVCRFGLPDVIISDNRTQFTIITVVDFCYDLGVKTNFIFVIYPHANG